MPSEHDCKPGVSFSPQCKPHRTLGSKDLGMLPKAPSLCPQGLCQHCLLLGIILTVLSGLLFDVAVSNVRPWVLEAREGECFMTSEIKAVGEVCIFFVCQHSCHACHPCC